jgi:hypothetical protein
VPLAAAAALLVAGVILAIMAGAFLLQGGALIPGDDDPYRSLRTVKVQAYYENGSAISIVDNLKAADPSYGTLASFLGDYGGPQGAYESGHVCSAYAVELHDKAESMGIRAGLVMVYFRGVVDPHLVVAFDTGDVGRVYVDATGLTPEALAQGNTPRLRIACIAPGSEYVLNYTAPYDRLAEKTGLIVDRSVTLN